MSRRRVDLLAIALPLAIISVILSAIAVILALVGR